MRCKTLATTLFLCAGGLMACGNDAERVPDFLVDLDDHALAVSVSDAQVAADGDRVSVHYRIETDEIEPIDVAADLDADGLGTVVMTSGDLRHELRLDRKLFLLTYDHGTQGREVGYYARPRGDMLTALSKRSAEVADQPDDAFANTPLQYLLVRSLDELHRNGAIDARYQTLVRAADMLAYRWSFDPTIAPAPTTYRAGWERAIEDQSVFGVIGGDSTPPAPAIARTQCGPVLQPVSGSAAILANSTTVGGVVDVNCAGATVSIGALGPAGSGFSSTSSGVNFNNSQAAVACPSDCSTGEIWPSCYKATFSGSGQAVVSPGAGFIGDGAADTAKGPNCSIKASSINLNVSIAAADASNNAVGGQARVSLSGEAIWDEDLIYNDLCSASGSGSASASLTGAGNPPPPPPCPTPTPTPSPEPSPSPSPSTTPTTPTTTTPTSTTTVTPTSTPVGQH